jgi:hypothetical protein
MAQGPGPSAPRPADDEMLEATDSEQDEENPNVTELRNLRRQARMHAQQMAAMQDMMNQLTTQLLSTPNEKAVPKKPKMATPEKYDGSRAELRAFLTNIDLYCEFNEVPNDQEKILTASMHMKGKASNWIQPYVEDYLMDIQAKGTKDETRTLFTSWTNFKEEMGRIFGEVDAKNQAEKAITRLRQTKSVSTYTAEFKQLQARIDWDDAALRTVFESGLKENVKDGLVHHDKPETLQALIELATRIDNRLWDRAQQKGRFQPTMANTRKQRHRTDKDGDTIMTGKVQETKDKKARGRGQDGLSTEERKKRYDSKACLRCGEVGHFRRDCPKNEVKQAAIKIGMIRCGTPYPAAMEPDDSLSDLDLYEEARQESDEAFEMVQEALGAKNVRWDKALETDWKIDGAEIQSRLRNHQCWVCGDAAHQADDCHQEGRIVITGPNAEEIGYQAIHEQPRFESPEAQVEEPEPRTFKARMTRHIDLHWVDCKWKQCRMHYQEKQISRENDNDCCHAHLETNECLAEQCHIHEPEKQERIHRRLCWMNCETKCHFHKLQYEKALNMNDYYHGTITAEECSNRRCRMHFGDSQESGRVTEDQAPAQPERTYEEVPHHRLNWTFCYDDYCQMHYSEKAGSGYFPRKRKGRQSKN